MSEGFEKEAGVDVERAATVLESSDEAVALEEAEGGLIEKWATDKRFQGLLDNTRREQGDAFDRAGLWGLAAAGGAFASLYGVPDNMMQYFDNVGQFELAEFAAKFDEVLIGALAAIKSMLAFKEGLDMKPAIERIKEGWKSASA